MKRISQYDTVLVFPMALRNRYVWWIAHVDMKMIEKREREREREKGKGTR